METTATHANIMEQPMSHRTKLAMYHAVDATLRLLMERRTKGRMELYLAIKDMTAELAGR